mgnify:FL=1
MRILTLTSSSRERGNTARTVGLIEQHLVTVATQRDEPLTIDRINLAHQDIRKCHGCRTCFDRGEESCPLEDDVPLIAARIEEADGLILASPVYVNDVNGVAKNWIDRMAYVCHRPAFSGKCAFLVATVADSPTSHTLRTMNVALRTWGFHIVGEAGFKMGALMEQETLMERFESRTARIAEDVFHAVQDEHYLNPSFISLMMFRIQQLSWRNVDEASIDYAYWQRHGWFDAGTTFFIDHRANPVKVALARLTGGVVSRFVT